MSQLLVNGGLQAQAAQLVAFVSCVDVEVVEQDSFALQGPDVNTSNLLEIVEYLSQRSSLDLKGQNVDESKEVDNLIQVSLETAQNNDYMALFNSMQDRLMLQSFLVGNALSAADIVVFVYVYAEYSSLENDAKYMQFVNVTRWFDMIQHVVEPSGLLNLIPLRQDPPKQKKKKDKKSKNKGPAQEQKERETSESKPSDKKGKKKKQQKGGGAKLADHADELEFIQHRIQVFDDLYQQQQARLSQQNGVPIQITLPDGTVKDGIAGETSPLTIAKEISVGLAKKAIVARVNGEQLWDMTRPFYESCQLEIVTFDDPDGKHVFWHSSSHVLGQCLERLFKGRLTVGPALDESQLLHNGGFYYDVDTSGFGDGVKISSDDYKEMEKLVSKIVKDKQPFQRLELSKEEALEMFKFNQFKQEIISDKIPDGARTTVYRCGPLIDLCRGPHIPSTNVIKAMKLLKNGATYWKNDKERESLQRVYGVSFPDKKEMKAYLDARQKAEEFDHRNVGKAQKLFFFDDFSPGSCFWLPHGARIYSALQAFMRKAYRDRGFTEVISPNMFSMKLWETSGHAQKYAENMFLFDVEGQQFGLKPMNCPGHCLMFGHEQRSYRDLPIRFADFGALHRNELTGSLTGLTRVRRFQQDDAHIFCRPDQIEQEIFGALDFLSFIYGTFGLEFGLELSTRPEKDFLGEIEVWNAAEAQLESCLGRFCEQPGVHPYQLNPGDGAFYGPKIDIKVFDSLKREHQCATIQLDFQLPIRFELEFVDDNANRVRPVIIHRAIYGSFERFIAILCEHFQGKWPFWVSPRQAIVVPITNTPELLEYAESIRQRIHDAGYWVDVDGGTDRFKKKIRNAQLSQYNFILVVGAEEAQTSSVNVRTRQNEVLGKRTIDELMADLNNLRDTYQ